MLLDPINDSLQLTHQSEQEKNDTKLRHQELYSFKTLKVLYQNVKVLMNSSIYKESRLN